MQIESDDGDFKVPLKTAFSTTKPKETNNLVELYVK